MVNYKRFTFKHRLFIGLVLLVIFLVANLLVLIKNEATFNQITLPESLRFLPFFNKYHHDITKLNFPIDQELMKDELFTTFKLSSYRDSTNKDKPIDVVFDGKYCSELKGNHDVKISPNKLLDVDFKIIHDQLAENSLYKTVIDKGHEKFNSKLPETNQWLRFAGSSVWLNDLKVHYMVSRLIYTPSGIPNKGFVSFLYVQIFDETWNELTTTLEIPYEKHIKEYTIDEDSYTQEMIIDRKLEFRRVAFPRLLPVQFETDYHTNYWGPEDPRILKRINPNFGFEEPIVVFNMKGLKLSKRVMHTYLPFSNNMQVLKKRNEPYANVEKNWTPFFSKFQSNRLNFMYSIKPLEILSCDLEDGMCDFLQKDDKQDRNYFGAIRGGTQLESIPFNDYLPKELQLKFPSNRQVYMGFARTHLTRCGCGESMYRPNLIILVEDYNPESNQFYYKLGDVSEFIDFNIEIPLWNIPKIDEEGNVYEDKGVTVCGKSIRNVLIPNSIAYWDIDSIIYNDEKFNREDFGTMSKKITSGNAIDLKNVIYNDYMGVTLSASDSDVRIVHIRGLINYILLLPSLFDDANVVQTDSDYQYGNDFNEKCSEISSKQYCIDYADANGGVVKY